MATIAARRRLRLGLRHCFAVPLAVLAVIAGCTGAVRESSQLPLPRSTSHAAATTSLPVSATAAPVNATGLRVDLVPAAGGTMGYLVGVPQAPAPAGGYPTIVYLHGFGERGNGSAAGLVTLEHTGLPQLAVRSQLPAAAGGFLLLAPQTDRQAWSATDVRRWLLSMSTRYPIDAHRTYLTGVSMGGGGVVRYLDTYGRSAGVAAAAPIAGDWTPLPPVTGLPSCPRLATTPIWAFAGDIDDVVPHQFSINLVGYLRTHCAAAEGDRLTLYQGRFHDVWTHTYDLSGEADKTDARFDVYRPDLYTWFLQHRLP